MDKHFSLAGSLALHRKALGWDILKAPVNVALAVPYIGTKLTAVSPVGSETISILILTFTGVTAQSQNYSPFRYEAEQALLNEFGKLAQQDWQPWRQQQEWRLQQADEQDDVIPQL